MDKKNLILIYASENQHIIYYYDTENKSVVAVRKDNDKKLFDFGSLKAFREVLRDKIKEDESLLGNFTGFGFKVLNGEAI